MDQAPGPGPERHPGPAPSRVDIGGGGGGTYGSYMCMDTFSIMHLLSGIEPHHASLFEQCQVSKVTVHVI